MKNLTYPPDDDEASQDATLTGAQTAAAAAESAGEQIGPYRLLERIGVGGMGEVWLAQQEEPVRRRVALKVIKLGMDTQEVVARFEAERQALALMSHPNIAKVVDAGSTPEGRPYFAMEYVPGVSITAYCDKHRLDARERLELFMQVCQAIQHAHQKSIIHRDIKPSNILVSLQDGVPVAKVIDFGIAKATSMRLTEKSLYTQHGMMIGTPVYMSPEQAEMTGLDVDTTTDIYSLGALLYELLVGALPFSMERLRSAGWEEMRRILREDDPPTPSSRLMTLDETSEVVAMRRQTDVWALQRRLRGDLDWIVMKAMEKDRTRRYDSASALGADIGRHLRNEPVAAGPPSALYRMRKFARRNRAAVIPAVGLFLLLAGFSVAMAVQASRIAEERDRANQEAETARQVTDFIQGLFGVADPGQARGDTITAREMLDRGAARIEDELADQPLVKARVLEAIGTVYRNLGLIDQATDSLRQALELRRSALADPDPELAASLNSFASILQDAGQLDESERLLREALEMRRRLYGDEHAGVATALNNLALVLSDKGDLAGAESLLRQALDMRRELLGDDHALVAATLNNLARTLKDQGKFSESEDMYREALDKAEQALGDDHPDVAAMLNNLAIVLRELGKLDDAEHFRRRSTDLARKLYGDDHPRVAADRNNLGTLLRSMGKYEEAEEAYRASLETFRTLLGDDHPSVGTVASNLAEALHGQGRLEEAEELLDRSLDIFRRRFGDSHPDVARTLVRMAQVAFDRGDSQRAEALFSEAVTSGTEALGPRHETVARALQGLGATRLRSGDAESAGPHLREAAEILREALPEDHWRIARAEGLLGAQLSALGDFAEAEPLLLKALEVLQETSGRSSDAERARLHLVDLYEAWGKPDRAAFYRIVPTEI